MTDRYWYANKGAQGQKDVTEATSHQASDIELRITFTNFTVKLNALVALEAIRQKIEQDPWPPA